MNSFVPKATTNRLGTAADSGGVASYEFKIPDSQWRERGFAHLDLRG